MIHETWYIHGCRATQICLRCWERKYTQKGVVYILVVESVVYEPVKMTSIVLRLSRLEHGPLDDRIMKRKHLAIPVAVDEMSRSLLPSSMNQLRVQARSTSLERAVTRSD